MKKKKKKRSTYFSHFKRVCFQTFECLHEHKYYVLCFQASKPLPHTTPSNLALFCLPMPINVNNVTSLRENCSFQFLFLILFSENTFFFYSIDDNGKVSLSMEKLAPPIHHNYNTLLKWRTWLYHETNFSFAK